jgi:hypothetical protein
MSQFDRFRSELWSFTYLAVRRVLSLVVLALRRSGSKEIEILVLRHELEILRRNQPRPCLQPADRAWLATLSRLLARERWSAFGVRPETLLRWHRRLVAGHWTYPQRHLGRPQVADEFAALSWRWRPTIQLGATNASEVSCFTWGIRWRQARCQGAQDPRHQACAEVHLCHLAPVPPDQTP